MWNLTADSDPGSMPYCVVRRNLYLSTSGSGVERAGYSIA